MKRTDFSYALPPSLIAQEPRERGRSRMMVVTPREGEPGIEHDTFASFPRQLAPGDVLVLNDTRVIPARLFGRRTGMTRAVEVLLTRPVTPSVSEGAGGAGGATPRPPRPLADARGDTMWEAWAKPAKRLRVGDVLTFSDTLTARVEEKHEGTVVLRFEGDLAEIDRIGVMPLPPYIARDEPRESDRESYQTVYANERGAIAAPTAGAHVTRAMAARTARADETRPVSRHVGHGDCHR